MLNLIHVFKYVMCYFQNQMCLEIYQVNGMTSHYEL